MHPALLAVLSAPDLTAAAKSVYAHLYAHTNGTLRAEVDRDELLAGLRMAESTLRRNRSELARAGVLQSWYAQHGEQVVLVFELADPRSPSERAEEPEEELEAAPRSPSARAPSERDHLVRAAQPAPRSPSDRQTPPRSPSARALGDRAERDDAQNPPPDPPMELVNIASKQQQLKPSCCSGGGAGEPDPDAAELLGAAGVAPHIVAELADLTFEAAARHVAAWQAARAEARPGETLPGVGALVKRLRTWAVPENLTADQLQAGLLADRVTPADLVAWGIADRSARSYIPAGYENIIQH